MGLEVVQVEDRVHCLQNLHHVQRLLEGEERLLLLLVVEVAIRLDPEVLRVTARRYLNDENHHIPIHHVEVLRLVLALFDGVGDHAVGRGLVVLRQEPQVQHGLDITRFPRNNEGVVGLVQEGVHVLRGRVVQLVRQREQRGQQGGVERIDLRLRDGRRERHFA